MKIVSPRIVVLTVAFSAVLLLQYPADAAPQSSDQSASGGPLEQQVVSAERQGLDALKAGDIQRFADLTADEAVFVDDHGPASKAQVMKNVAGFKLTDYSMDDIKFLPISPNTGLISYKITEKGNSHGKDFTAQAYISSIWTDRGSEWLCLFSQETAVRRPPPAQ